MHIPRAIPEPGQSGWEREMFKCCSPIHNNDSRTLESASEGSEGAGLGTLRDLPHSVQIL